MKKGYSLGEVKVVDGVFLGKQELDRQQFFLGEKLRFLLSLGGVGILDKEDFLVSTDGVGTGMIKLPESLAIDSLGNMIYKEEQSGIRIPEGSFWLVVRAKKTPLEKGVCSVTQNNGVYTVNGVGTEFTKMFRNSSSRKLTRIEFEKIDSTQLLQNQGTYIVLRVVSDTQILLSTPIYDEAGLKIKAVGTFSQDLVPTNTDRFVYNKYGSELLLVPEIVSGQKPGLSSYGIDGETVFPIASILNSQGSLVIKDRRETFYTKLESFAREGQWETLSLQPNFTSSSTFPIQIRVNHFKNQLEIFGKFTATVSQGTILILPEKFKPNKQTILSCVS